MGQPSGWRLALQWKGRHGASGHRRGVVNVAVTGSNSLSVTKMRGVVIAIGRRVLPPAVIREMIDSTQTMA